MPSTLPSPPFEGITKIGFDPTLHSNFLGCTSWDSKFRLYDTENLTAPIIFQESQPLLDFAFVEDAQHVAAVGLDPIGRYADLQQPTQTIQSFIHQAPIKCVCYHSEMKLIYTGSWDHTVKAWDTRVATAVAEIKLKGKCFCLDAVGTKLVIGDSAKQIYIIDLQNGPGGFQKPMIRDAIMKFQFRNVKCFKDCQGFGLSSIEGRVALEYFDMNPLVQAKNYAFKCHRVKDENGVELIYPVNALAFHSRPGIFATGGSDGGVSVWDGNVKKRLWKVPSCSAGISSIAFDSSCQHLAIASCECFDSGANTASQASQILVYNLKQEGTIN